MNKLTREQAALLGCFTGTLFGPFSDVHKKAEQALGRPIFTHEFATSAIWDQLKTALTEELLAICPDEGRRMTTLRVPLNGKHVDVEFVFNKGYETTFNDPGCPDDCEVHRVFYPADSKDQVDILPVMHEDDVEAIYDYIFDYRGEDE